MEVRLIFKILLLILSIGKCNAQKTEPFYEQIAFDFYSNQILKEIPVNKKITVAKELNYTKSIHYLPSDCLKNKIENKKNANDINIAKHISDLKIKKYELDLSKTNRNQFRVIKKLNVNDRGLINHKNSIFLYKPKLFEERVFVIIDQVLESNGTVYTIELDKKGNIIDWCKSSEYEQLIIE